MNEKEIQDKVSRLLTDLTEQSAIIRERQGRDILLELDTMMEDVRQLYRCLLVLRGEQPSYQQTTSSLAGDDNMQPAPPSETRPSAPVVVPSFFHDSGEDDAAEESQIPASGSSSDTDGSFSEPPKTKASIPDALSSTAPEIQQGSDTSEPSQKGKEKTVPSTVENAPQEQVTDDRPANEKIIKSRDEGRSVKEHGSGTGEPKPDRNNQSKSVIDLFSQQNSRSIADHLGKADNSLHQRILSQKEDKSIGTRLQQHPIDNIRDAIGVNEKFLFINELFHGDIQAYNQAISRLNEAGSMENAFAFLNSLTKELGWDAGQMAETVEKLAGFVQRRYSSG